jgi:hypothetical protein
MDKERRSRYGRRGERNNTRGTNRRGKREKKLTRRGEEGMEGEERVRIEQKKEDGEEIDKKMRRRNGRRGEGNIIINRRRTRERNWIRIGEEGMGEEGIGIIEQTKKEEMDKKRRRNGRSERCRRIKWKM